MSVIWEAEETALKRVVALKVSRGFAFSSEADRLRFHTEASAVAQLDHPGIVPIYEVGEIEEQPFFTMKLLEGGTLAQRMKDGPLDARESAGTMEKLARAVDHAHRRGVLHRDLKPGNVPLAVLPEGRLATMERSTSDIILWQEDGETVRETARIWGPGYIQGFSGLLRGIVLPGGTKIAGILPGRIFVVDLETGTVAAAGDEVWETGPARVWDLAASPDGRHLIATGLGHRARLYDPSNLEKPARDLGNFRNYDTALAFPPDGSRLHIGNEDGRVRMFETMTWNELPAESKSAPTPKTISSNPIKKNQITHPSGHPDRDAPPIRRPLGGGNPHPLANARRRRREGSQGKGRDQVAR